MSSSQGKKKGTTGALGKRGGKVEERSIPISICQKKRSGVCATFSRARGQSGEEEGKRNLPPRSPVKEGVGAYFKITARRKEKGGELKKQCSSSPPIIGGGGKESAILRQRKTWSWAKEKKKGKKKRERLQFSYREKARFSSPKRNRGRPN